jgi:hypothetical protein
MKTMTRPNGPLFRVAGLRPLALALLILLYSKGLEAQFIEDRPGFTGAALAGATLALDGTAAFWDNPAALAEQRRLGLSFFGKIPFGQEMLRTGGTAVAWGKSGFGAAFLAGAYGNAVHRGQHFGLKAGRRLSKSTSLGFGMAYTDTKTGALEQRAEVRAEVGALFDLGLHWRAGALVAKGIGLGTPTASPWLMRGGISYRPDTKTAVCLEAHVRPGERMSVRAGVLWSPVEPIELGCGFSTEPLSASLGARYRLGKVRLGTAVGWHPDLGFTPTVEGSANW